MSDGLILLRDTLYKNFPDSKIEPLSEGDLADLRTAYIGVPDHYLAFLREVGCGSFGPSCLMIYSAPFEPSEFFDEETSSDLADILFIGDNFSGWMVGFDTANGWSLVGIDSCSPVPEPLGFSTLSDFFWEWIADNTKA